MHSQRLVKTGYEKNGPSTSKYSFYMGVGLRAKAHCLSEIREFIKLQISAIVAGYSKLRTTSSWYELGYTISHQFLVDVIYQPVQ